MRATNTAYSVAGLVDAVRRELKIAPGMPGTFDDGAKWALGNVEGRASRADQLHAVINGDQGSEFGWLIELKSSVSPTPTYYGENEEGVLGWTADHMKALRFARREDADLVIRCEGWTEAFAAEHGWDGAKPK
jgi:hypothetical protein